MEERYLKFEDLMADLAAYLVSEYDIEPRDAAAAHSFSLLFRRSRVFGVDS